MNNLLIFFAFPIAVIIISIILEKLLNNPLLVASLVFATFLIITFTAFDETFLIATLAYTVLALITSFISKIICNSNIGRISLESTNEINNEEINNNEESCINYNRYKHY